MAFINTNNLSKEQLIALAKECKNNYYILKRQTNYITDIGQILEIWDRATKEWNEAAEIELYISNNFK